MSADNKWMQGSQLLAVLMERFAPGQVIEITRADVEALSFGTSHPVVFTLEDADMVRLEVVRPKQSG